MKVEIETNCLMNWSVLLFEGDTISFSEMSGRKEDLPKTSF